MSRGRPYSKSTVTISQERLYELVRRPLVTEKSTLGSEHNQVAFVVPLDARKPEIKVAVESLFEVKVKAINTLCQAGKIKRFRGRPGKRAGTKKAYVTLVEGHSIDVTTGI